MEQNYFSLLLHHERNLKHSWATVFGKMSSTPSPKSLPVKTWGSNFFCLWKQWGFYPSILAMVPGYIMISVHLSHLNKSKTVQYQLVLCTLWFSHGICFLRGCLSGASKCFSKYLSLFDSEIKDPASRKWKNLDWLKKEQGQNSMKRALDNIDVTGSNTNI